MRLCVITDEVNDDAPRALLAAESMGVSAVEIRVVDGRNITEHPPEDWRVLAGLLRAGGFACPVVDSPFLKETPLPGDDDWTGLDWTPFERAMEVAGVLGARTVRVFSGRRRATSPGGHPDGARPTADGRSDVGGWLADVLAEAVGRARTAGLRVAVEIEHVCTIATAAEALAFASESTVDGWGYVLDPGNESYLTGAPADAALVPVLAPRISHVHVKDVAPLREWVRVGTGLVGWAAHLAALRGCAYDGYLSMETHYAVAPDGLETATRESVAALRELAGATGVSLT